MAHLKIRNLSAVYEARHEKIHALQDVSFELLDSESVGIAGESACGKSTLGLSIMRMLLGGTASGEILLDGESILDLDEAVFDEKFRWKRISMIFQGAMSSLDPVFTIRQQFQEIQRQHGASSDSAIIESITSVGLDEQVLDKYPHELSGGMKQRAVIAMALILKPDIVVADEPTTALDVLTQAQIIALVKNLKKNGTSFVLISHDLAILSEIVEKIGIMYAGQLVEFGSSSDIYQNPRHPYTRGLLKSIPTLRGGSPEYIRGTPPSLAAPDKRCRFIDRCPLAMEKCIKDPPNFSTDSGFVKCWLYE